MIEYEIEVSNRPEDNTVTAAVEYVCEAEGLVIQMKSSLKKFPGSTHWHFRRPGARGILELTWWPSETKRGTDRMWLSIHGNRKAEWMSELLPRMKTLVEARLSVST